MVDMVLFLALPELMYFCPATVVYQGVLQVLYHICVRYTCVPSVDYLTLGYCDVPGTLYRCTRTVLICPWASIVIIYGFGVIFELIIMNVAISPMACTVMYNIMVTAILKVWIHSGSSQSHIFHLYRVLFTAGWLGFCFLILQRDFLIQILWWL